MAQVKVYALENTLARHTTALSKAIHDAVMLALDYPAEKRFHRFIALTDDRFFYPEDRGEHYTVIEISIFEGRSAAAKKQLIRLLFDNIERATGIPPRAVEITLFETPRHHWGIRGKPGDELTLDYRIDV